MNEGQPGRLAAALIPAVLALTALLATACSGSHPVRSGASPGQGNVQQLDVFAACMRGHGVLNFYFTNSPPIEYEHRAEHHGALRNRREPADRPSSSRP